MLTLHTTSPLPNFNTSPNPHFPTCKSRPCCNSPDLRPPKRFVPIFVSVSGGLGQTGSPSDFSSGPAQPRLRAVSFQLVTHTQAAHTLLSVLWPRKAAKLVKTAISHHLRLHACASGAKLISRQSPWWAAAARRTRGSARQHAPTTLAFSQRLLRP